MTATRSTKTTTPAPSVLSRLCFLVAGSAIGLAAGWLAFGGGAETPAIDSTLLDGEDLIERIARFAPALDGASPSSLGSLREIVENFDPGPQEAELALFVEWWARLDPESALDWAKAVEDQTGLPLKISAYRAWARQAPQEALAHASANLAMTSPQLLNGAIWQDHGLQAVLIGWDQSEQPGLYRWIFEIEQPQDRQGLMAFLARQRLASQPAEEVWEWALNLPGSLPFEMLPRVASALAARDPLEAVRLSAPQIEQHEFPSLPRRIATRWARRDPAAALEWLSTLPEGSVRRDGVLETARTWIGLDPEGFMAYAEERLDAFPEWLDPGFELYARTLAVEGEPRSAAETAQRLRNKNRRVYTITLVLRSWLGQDRAAAEAWMDANEIDPGIRTRARHGIR